MSAFPGREGRQHELCRNSGELGGGLADQALADRLDDAVLHEHILELVHADWRRDGALPRIIVDLGRELLPLLAARRLLPDEQQPRDVLGKIVHARDENGAELSNEQKPPPQTSPMCSARLWTALPS